MAHIFKHPTGDNKGIVVFTHKEWRSFSGGRIRRNLKEILTPKTKLVVADPTGYPKNFLDKVSEKYFIGVHFGGYQFRYQLDKIPFTSNYVDFALSVESTLPNLSEDIYRIPLNCRNFIPARFREADLPKVWDFVTVGRDVTVKNYPGLFKSIKKVLEIDPKATFLLIVPSQKKMKAGAVSALTELYYRTFTQAEQEQIAFLYLHPELDIGLNQSQLIKFYNLSKVFTLFSIQLKTRFFEYGEGDSRVISEALCCHLPVVCYAGMKGGGRDYLTENNSVLFDSYDQAHLALLEARDKFGNGIKDTPEMFTREDFSIEKLHTHFADFYRSKNQEYDGNLINTDHLDVRIPSHYSNVPWSVDKLQPTTDLKTKQQFEIFLEHLQL